MRRPQRPHAPTSKRAHAIVAAAIFATLTGAAPALADSATMSVTDTAGQPDPAAGVSRIFTVSGTSSVPKRLFVKYRAPGGAPCAPSAYEDTGSYGPFWDGDSVNGAFSFQLAHTWQTPGTFNFCFWLATNSETIATPFTQTITFRGPTGTITATLSPPVPTIAQSVSFAVTGASETPARVYAKIRPGGGAGCAPTAYGDSGSDLIDGERVDGAFSLPATSSFATPGEYLLCLWLARSSDDPSPIAGPQPQPFTVAAPPPVSRISSATTIRRTGSRPARYSGRVSTLGACRRNREVVLRRAGSGSRSFGRARTRPNGTYTIRRSSRLRGRVYALVTLRRQGLTMCLASRSRIIRG